MMKSSFVHFRHVEFANLTSTKVAVCLKTSNYKMVGNYFPYIRMMRKLWSQLKFCVCWVYCVVLCTLTWCVTAEHPEHYQLNILNILNLTNGTTLTFPRRPTGLNRLMRLGVELSPDPGAHNFIRWSWILEGLEPRIWLVECDILVSTGLLYLVLPSIWL